MDRNGKKNIKIALTGGIGSGKSAAGNILKELGFPVFSCDEIYAELCGEKEFLEILNKNFPGCVKCGKLDRKSLSSTVFRDEAARRKLNALSHPLIMERVFEEMSRYPVSFAEVPLLFECGAERAFDHIFVILRDQQRRIAAVRARSGLKREQILARMARQFCYPSDPRSYPPNCILLENNGSLSDLKTALQKAISEIL